MGKRYYCDYCDRSFKDDPEARKKHLSGLQHARNRSEHYARFKDAETIFKEESAKTPCKRFMAYGDCAFGKGCRFSHYTPAMMWELQRYVSFENQDPTFAIFQKVAPNPDDVIKEFFENVEDRDTVEHNNYSMWNFPGELLNYPNLPPSLWPITPDSVTDTVFGKWGL